MGYPGVTFPDLLTPELRVEFEQLTALMQGYLSVQHHDDGSHGDVTADTVASKAGYTERGRTLPMGEWTAMIYAAANFTGNGTQTWTVSSADVQRLRYSLIGLTLLYEGRLETTSVGGGANTELRVALPPGLQCAYGLPDQFCGLMIYVDNGGARTVGEVWGRAGATYLSFVQSGGGNWAGAANTTAVDFSVTVEIVPRF